MRQLPPLAAVRAFEATGRLENFTAAAVELGMTQAAVSYQIKALEAAHRRGPVRSRAGAGEPDRARGAAVADADAGVRRDRAGIRDNPRR